MRRTIKCCGLGVVLLLAACQSSEKPTALTPGDPGDESFQFVSEDVLDQHSLVGVEVGLDLSGTLVDSVPGAAPVRARFAPRPAVEDGELVIESYSYSHQGTWHVFQVSGFVAWSSPVDTFNLVAVDSIQFVANETPVVYPDETVDGFNYNLYLDLWSRTQNDSVSGAHVVQVRFSEEFTAILHADLSESIRFQHSDSAKTCDVDVANTFEAQGIEIDFLNDGCPLDGDIFMSSAISIDCQGTGGGFSASVDGVWSIHAAFDGSTESYTVSNGSTVWSYSEPCGGGTLSARP